MDPYEGCLPSYGFYHWPMGFEVVQVPTEPLAARSKTTEELVNAVRDAVLHCDAPEVVEGWLRQFYVCAVARIDQRAGSELLQDAIDKSLLEVSQWEGEEWVRPCESPSVAAAEAATSEARPLRHTGFQCAYCHKPVVERGRCTDCIERGNAEAWQFYANRKKPVIPLPKKISARLFRVSEDVFTDFCRDAKKQNGKACPLLFCPFMHRWEDCGKSSGHIFRSIIPEEYRGRIVCHFELTLGRDCCWLREECPYSHDVDGIREKLKELRSAYQEHNRLNGYD